MARQPIDWKVLSQRGDSLLGLFLLGLGAFLIWLAAFKESQVWIELFGSTSKDWGIALGGAVLGAGFSIFAVAFATHTRDQELNILLEGAIPYGGFDTTEEKLHKFRQKYYCYYVNEHPGKGLGAKSQKGWYHTVLDFRKYRSGKLWGTLVLSGNKYQVEGFLKKDSLIICRTNEDKVDQELVASFVLQDFANIYPKDFYGVLLTETLVGGRSVSACILSTRPLIDCSVIELQLAENQDGEIEDFMVKHVRPGILLTPNITSIKISQANSSENPEDNRANVLRDLSRTWFQGMRNYGYMMFHLPGLHDPRYDVFGELPEFGEPERKPRENDQKI